VDEANVAMRKTVSTSDGEPGMWVLRDSVAKAGTVPRSSQAKLGTLARRRVDRRPINRDKHVMTETSEYGARKDYCLFL
jgi:hypothetical protein